MYLTYDEYRQFGGALDKTTFTDYAFEAASQINWYTFNRLEKEETVNEKVKMCMYKLINLIQSVNDFQSGGNSDGSTAGAITGIASQTNDGVSISYNVLTASECVDMAKSEIKRVINIYLSGVIDSLGRKVLYRGVYPGE